MAKRGSVEWIQNISKSRKGQFVGKENPFYGKHHSEKTKRFLSGRVVSDEARKKNSDFHKGKIPWNKGKPWSDEMRVKISKSLQGKPNLKIRGNNHYAWAGDSIGYTGLHTWINKEYGKALVCEQCESTKNVDWAKRKGKEYSRDRENWLQLCRSCHHRYDGRIKNLKVSSSKPK